MVLVESIPEHMTYKGNVTLGLPLGKAWQKLISMATEQVDLVSFYWTLTGEDIGVNSSSDLPVSGPQSASPKTPTLRPCVSPAGTRHPEGTGAVGLQERQCPSLGQHSQREGKLHRFKDPQTKRSESGFC